MDTNAREQIGLVLGHLMDKSRSALNERIDQIYSRNSASGRLQSGYTVKVALAALEDAGEQLLRASVDQVGAIAKDVEAFALLHLNFETYFRFLEQKLTDVLRVSGAVKHGVATSRASGEGNARLQAIRRNLDRQLEIHRFTFNQPMVLPPSGAANPPVPVATVPSAKNAGGKPLAGHWDAMWAAIAVKLYVGDLQPGSQADIERAMNDWFAAQDLDIGDTTIRGRARALWSQIQAAQ